MLSRSLLARSSPLRLSATLRTRVSSRSLNILRLPPPPQCTVSWSCNLRRFSTTPAAFIENQDDNGPSYTPSGTCYVANIPYQVTAEQLKDAFSEFGKITSINFLTTAAGLPRGAGFIQFESIADAVSFVNTHKADPIFVLDRQLSVEHAQRASKSRAESNEPSDTLMVLELQESSDAEVRAMFGSYAHNILAVRFDRKEAGQPVRKAFVQFRDVDVATEAMDIFKDQNENIRIAYARQRQPPTRSYSLTSRLSKYRSHSM